MKNFLRIISLFCVFVFGFFVNNYFKRELLENDKNKNEQVFSMNENGSYAKVLNGCNLYKTQEMKDEIEFVYFQIPETYFVMILEDINDKCLKVKYDNFVGFVKKSFVEIASFVPIVKFLSDVRFDIKSNSGTQIWSLPSTDSNICTTISAGTKNLEYIASAIGVVPSGGESNIWYYVCYTPASNSTNVYEGYIYSENTTNLSEIVSNNETNPVKISDEFKEEKLLYISSTIKTIIVAVIAIPVILFFVIILYKIIKKFNKNTNKYKNNSKIETVNFEDFDKTQNMKSIEKYKNMKLLNRKNLEPQFNDFDDEDLL